MSYQPYPSGGAQPYPAGGNQLGQRPEQPTSVRNAVWLMYGGAALSAISAILVLALSSSLKRRVGTALRNGNNTLRSEGKKVLTAAQIHGAENFVVGVIVLILVVGLVLWIWMAWANGRGRSWARIMASVLFGLNTLLLFLFAIRAGIAVLFVGLGWLLGLGAIVLLWRKESSYYFQPRRTL